MGIVDLDGIHGVPVATGIGRHREKTAPGKMGLDLSMGWLWLKGVGDHKSLGSQKTGSAVGMKKSADDGDGITEEMIGESEAVEIVGGQCSGGMPVKVVPEAAISSGLDDTPMMGLKPEKMLGGFGIGRA